VPDPELAARDTIIQLLARFETPCAYGAPVGHGSRNAAVPFGASCDLVLGGTSSLTINEGAVA
jgi:muramoyltetrapeptide carboxypeptidase LdcA involved in peptidoglycan recycling